jgi:RND family efflux transporter MFP subunit
VFAAGRLERTRELFTQGNASAEQLQEVESLAERAEQEHREAAAAQALLVAGTRPERIARATALNQAQADEIARLEQEIALHQITAPFGGWVTTELTEQGQWLAAGEPVVELIDLSAVEIEVQVPESELGTLQKGRQAQVRIEALPQRAFTGEVVAIVPQAHPRARTLPVRVRVANEVVAAAPVLKAGESATATLPVGDPVVALLVPKDALALGRGAPLVFVVAESDGRATARAVVVQLGVADGGWIQVEGELRAGEWVVVQGNERLKSGEELQVTRQPGPQSPAPHSRHESSAGSDREP